MTVEVPLVAPVRVTVNVNVVADSVRLVEAMENWRNVDSEEKAATVAAVLLMESALSAELVAPEAIPVGVPL